MIFPFKLNSSVLITCIFFFTEEREVTGTKLEIKTTMPSITLLTSSLPSSSKNVKLPTVPVPLDQLKHQVELI